MLFAERATGLSNWGERDFLHRLAIWLAAIASDRGLNDEGEREVNAWTFQHACNRLRLEALIAKHPEIEEIQIEAPIIVSGLPRSGTTALARALARNQSDSRWLPYWESIEPFSGFYNARVARARRRRDALRKISPTLADLHDCTEDAFVDDTELQCLAFGSYALEWHAHVPGWRDAYLASDQTPVYLYLKRALQALSFLRGARRWIIKSPQHMEQLQALANVFPDAVLMLSIREPRRALRSMDRVMAASATAFRSRPFPQTYWSERFDVMLARYDEGKRQFEGRRELDLAAWPHEL